MNIGWLSVEAVRSLVRYGDEELHRPTIMSLPQPQML